MRLILDTWFFCLGVITTFGIDLRGSAREVLECYSCSGSNCMKKNSEDFRTCSVAGNDAKCFIKRDPSGDMMRGCASPTRWETRELRRDGCRLLPLADFPTKSSIVCLCSEQNRCNADILNLVELYPNEDSMAVMYILEQQYSANRPFSAHAYTIATTPYGQGRIQRRSYRKRSADKRTDVTEDAEKFLPSTRMPPNYFVTHESHTIPETFYKMATSGLNSVIHGGSSEILGPDPFIPKYRDCRIHNGYCDHVCVMSWNGMGYCTCHHGYRLSHDLMTCDDINECQTDNGGCQHNCHNTPGSFYCTCLQGYNMASDNSTCQEVDECISSNAGGCSDACINTPGSYLCTCPEGFHLKRDRRTCQDTDECKMGIASCQQLCTNTEGAYVCGCTSGFSLDADGHTCIDQNECETDNGGCNQECINSLGSYACGCRMGYDFVNDTKTCFDIDECSEGNGQCEQFCTNFDGGYSCSCALGYQLQADNRTCLEVIPGDKCIKHNGGCDHLCTVIDASTVACSCDQGYLLLSNGKTCVDIDECQLSPCQGQCVNTAGSYQCLCLEGYRLQEDGSCTDVNECSTDNGGCEDVCINTDGSFFCACPLGYWLSADGLHCVDVDECQMNNGGCTGLCTNSIGSYNCSCGSGYVSAGDGKNCIDIDECNAENYGGCEQICVNTAGSYICGCADGYRLATDSRNCEDTNECARANGGCDQVCINLKGSYRCECFDGYSRDYLGTCQDIDECLYGLDNCTVLCVNTPGSFRCECEPGYKLSEQDFSTCTDVDECVQQNGGCEQYCQNEPGSYRCACADGSGFVLADDGRSCHVNCPAPFQPAPDFKSCHLIVTDRKRNFEEAEEYCRRLHAHAHLINPENTERALLLQPLFSKMEKGDRNVWTAGRYWHSVANYVWITTFDIISGFNVTKPAEVTSPAQDSCLLANWNDGVLSVSGEDCDVQHNFVCEIKIQNR